MTNHLSIIIMAAGKGSRMKSHLPKVLHLISGKPMLYYIIKSSLKLSDDITVVVNTKNSSVQTEVRKTFKNIKFRQQDIDKFPGTGGAIMNVSTKYEKILLLNGDMPLVDEEAIKKILNVDGDIVMSILKLDNPHGYGRVIFDKDGVKSIIEQKDANEMQLQIKMVNAGVYLFCKKVLQNYLPKLSNSNAQKEYYITDLIAMVKADKKSIIPIIVDEKKFMGINSKDDLAKAEIIMQNCIKKYWMRQGVTMHLPSTIYIEDGVTFAGECELENGVHIKGNTNIKASYIKAHSIIENSNIENSTIGPMAHIRPHSSISDTHIGNFVEIKRSTLKGVKAGHLSYLGDSQIGEGTNISAGVITCNYDGKSKHKTTIGKNVFVGSNSQLIAPIIIEDDVLVAAGTTVTPCEIKSGNLVLSRVPQKLIKNFYYKFFKKKV